MKAAFRDGQSMKIQDQRPLQDIWVKTHENMWGREGNLVHHIRLQNQIIHELKDILPIPTKMSTQS